ncbi:MAG: hypothetical protein V1777_04340 [Candidatus Micrarchaeota archaeon]
MKLQLRRKIRENWPILSIILILAILAAIHTGMIPGLTGLTLGLTEISIFIAIIALLFSGYELKQNAKISEIQAISKFSDDIDNLSQQLFDLEANGAADGKTQLKARRLDSRLFNRIEFFAFLINRGHLHEEYTEFFNDAIIDWYEGIFLKHATEEEKTNPKYYNEFKTLYKKIKNAQPANKDTEKTL